MRKRQYNVLCTALVASLAVLALSRAAAAPARPLKEHIAACEAKWEALYQKLQPNSTALLAAWSEQEASCRGTGVYELHRAGLLGSLGRLHEAAEYLRSALNKHLPTQDSLRVAYFSVRSSEAELAHDAATLRAVSRETQRFVAAHPQDPYALSEEAAEFVALRDFQRAAAAAKRAADLDRKSWEARYWFVIAASRLHTCPAARPYIAPAIMLNTALLAQKDFMYAAAGCYIDMGMAPTAKNVLISLSRRNAAVISDPLYQELWGRADMEAARSQ